MVPPPSLAAPAGAPEPREPHGPIARAVMVVVGVLIVAPFGALGGLMAFDVARASGNGVKPGATIVAALLLAISAYGAWLTWRGLRGYSRPTARTNRLLLVTAALLLACGVAAFVSMVVRVFTVGPVIVQHATWHSFDGTAWYSTMMTLALPLQLVAHELGHVVAGQAVGYEFLSIQVGPICLDRPARRWRVTWQPLQFGLGGRATVLCHGSRGFPQRSAVFAAGGPAANLLVAVVAWVASAGAPVPGTAAAAVALGVLKGCAAEGIILCVLNLLPVPGTGTDGARILHALRNPRSAGMGNLRVRR